MTVTLERGPTYSIVTVDLGTAHDNYELYCPGDRISVISCTGELDIRLDEPDNPPIEVDKITRLSTIPLKFTYLYFSNTAQTGKSAVLYVGREASFEAYPLRLGAIGLLDSSDTRINPAKEDGNLKALVDDTIKGLMRSIGDAGTSPLNTTGATLLKRTYDIDFHVTEARAQKGYSRSAYNSSTATALTVTLDISGYNAGKSIVEVWVKSSAAADFYVEGSRNNTDWRTIDTISLSAAGESHKGYWNAYPYVRCRTTAANDNEIEIVAVGA